VSKLAKAITATFTGDLAAVRKMNLKYTDVKFEQYEHTDAYAARVYKVQAKFGMQSVVDRVAETYSQTDLSSMVMKDIKRGIIEEVFGEFRPYLIEMRTAIYDQDDTRLRTLLANLEQQMFYDGVE